MRLRQVCLVAEKLEPVVADLTAVLGLEVAYRDPLVVYFGLENAVMPINGDFLEVVAPVQENTTAGRYLERRGGNGGYMVLLQCADAQAERERITGPRRPFGFHVGQSGVSLHPLPSPRHGRRAPFRGFGGSRSGFHGEDVHVGTGRYRTGKRRFEPMW